jgi:hypothetical protein
MRARGLILGCIVICIAALAVPRAQADEIRLKDGQKLYGVIVAYEDNMFKVKTDFGFVLVEKDKIAAIIPASPGAHPAAKPETQPAKSPSPAPVKPSASKPVAPVTTAHKEVPAPATPAPAPVKSVAPPPTASNDSKPAKTATAEAPKTAPVSTPAATSALAVPSTAPKPLSEKKSPPPSSATPAAETASAAKPPAVSNAPVVTPVPAKPKVIEPPPNREAVQGNLYINYSHGFRMYKAPSWKLIEDAPQALPNAIVAMGTANESTLMVVGQEKTKSSLEATAADVEKRLRDTYGNYRRISLNKTVAGGFPAIEIKYRGLAEDHDWSGTLLVVSRSGDMFSVLGMTYSDTDLIQIQENVIARAIASLEFNSN